MLSSGRAQQTLNGMYYNNKKQQINYSKILKNKVEYSPITCH